MTVRKIYLGRSRSLRGYGADVEDINCPAGSTANGDASGNVWCEDAAGNRTSASLAPSTKLAGRGLGVVGWGLLVAGGLVLASVVMKKR